MTITCPAMAAKTMTPSGPSGDLVSLLAQRLTKNTSACMAVLTAALTIAHNVYMVMPATAARMASMLPDVIPIWNQSRVL